MAKCVRMAIDLLILLLFSGDWSTAEEWEFLIDNVLDVLEMSGDGSKMGVDGFLVRFVNLWHRENSEKSKNGKGESREPRSDVCQRPENKSEFDRFQWALNEDELLQLIGNAGGVLNEHISLSVNLFLWKSQVLCEDL